MENLYFKNDLSKKIINTFFYLLYCAYLCLSGLLIENFCFIVICFGIVLLILINLIVCEYCKRNIQFDNEKLNLKILYKNTTINLSHVSNYSLDNPTINTIFCKSNKNICLFYEGKEKYVSVKKMEMLEKKLSELNIEKTKPVINLKPKKINFDYLLVLFLISIMAYLLNAKKVVNFWNILIFIFIISLFLIKEIILLIQIKECKE